MANGEPQTQALQAAARQPNEAGLTVDCQEKLPCACLSSVSHSVSSQGAAGVGGQRGLLQG